jgi:uncharacterized protein with HEPN domain
MTRHRARARDYVEHMLEASMQIQKYVSGMSEADFLNDALVQDGVVRRLEVLGEAARQLRDVLPDAYERFPAIPFRTMYAMRNELIHGYIHVNYELVYSVTEKEIPGLIVALEDVLRSWPEDLT